MFALHALDNLRSSLYVRHGTGMNSDIVDEGKKTRFKPGKSGNLAGPPRRKRIRTLLQEVLEVSLSPEALKLVRPRLRAELTEGATYADVLVSSLVLTGIQNGDVARFREILACEASGAEIMDSE